jgi:hypothetical protein
MSPYIIGVEKWKCIKVIEKKKREDIGERGLLVRAAL